MKHCTIKHIIIGAAFDIPKRGSRVTVEYDLRLDVPASATKTGRREYVSAKVGFTADSVDVAVAQVYEHAAAHAWSLLENILKTDEV